MKVEKGLQVLLIKGVDERRLALGNVGMAKQLPHHGHIITFGEGIIIGLAGAGWSGEVDQQRAEERATHPLISQPTSVPTLPNSSCVTI
jgi:hypothetical protein